MCMTSKRANSLAFPTFSPPQTHSFNGWHLHLPHCQLFYSVSTSYLSISTSLLLPPTLLRSFPPARARGPLSMLDRRARLRPPVLVVSLLGHYGFFLFLAIVSFLCLISDIDFPFFYQGPTFLVLFVRYLLPFNLPGSLQSQMFVLILWRDPSSRQVLVRMAAEGATKKLRKPYTITKSRDRWTSEEHERFLDALLLFGRDWKRIEDFIGTKTTIQIRSHAQKYFLKVQKIGLAAHVPPPHPRRKTSQSIIQRNPVDGASVASPSMSNLLVPECSNWNATSSIISYNSEPATFSDCYTSTCDSSFHSKVNVYGQNINWTGHLSPSWRPECHDDPKRVPYQSHHVPEFSQVYSFIGSMIDPDIVAGDEFPAEKLREMDPITAKTVLVLIKNLAANLSSPEFVPLKRWLSAYDPVTGTINPTIHDGAEFYQELNA